MRISDWSSDVCSSDLTAGCSRPLPVAADESIQTVADLDRLSRFYQVVNIKLDKCGGLTDALRLAQRARSEEHTSELQSLMRNSYAVFCLKKKKIYNTNNVTLMFIHMRPHY